MKREKCLKATLAIASLLIFFSCTDNLGQGGRGRLTLSTNMVGTRSPYADNTWDGGEPVNVYIEGAKYVDETDVPADVYTFTASSDGGLTPPEEMYWPESGGVTVYAYYSPQALSSWSIKTDQSTDENLKASDFIYATSGTTPLTADVHALTFYHQEAQVIINLSVSNDYPSPQPDLSKVTLQVYGYTAKKPDPTSPDTTNPTKYCQWSGAETVNPITAYQEDDQFTVLLPPRSMVTDDLFLHVSKGDGTETTYKLPEDFDILSGHTYTFDAVITPGGVEVQIIGADETEPPLIGDPEDDGDLDGTLAGTGGIDNPDVTDPEDGGDLDGTVTGTGGMDNPDVTDPEDGGDLNGTVTN